MLSDVIEFSTQILHQHAIEGKLLWDILGVILSFIWMAILSLAQIIDVLFADFLWLINIISASNTNY